MKARRIGTTTEFDVEGIIMNGIGYVMEDVEVLPTVTELSTEPDKELLDALKKICKVAPSYIKNPDDELDNAICDAMLAVYDYELNEETK